MGLGADPAINPANFNSARTASLTVVLIVEDAEAEPSTGIFDAEAVDAEALDPEAVDPEDNPAKADVEETGFVEVATNADATFTAVDGADPL